MYGQLVEVVGKAGRKTGIVIKEIHTAGKSVSFGFGFLCLRHGKTYEITASGSGEP